jgi:hypothetical protein
MLVHDVPKADQVHSFSVDVKDIVDPAEAAFRNAVNPTGQWFHADEQRFNDEEIDTDEYLLSGIKLALTAGSAAVNGAERYQEALERVQSATLALAMTDDPEKQKKYDVLLRQQTDLGMKISQFKAVATQLGSSLDELFVRFWHLHPSRTEQGSLTLMRAH